MRRRVVLAALGAAVTGAAPAIVVAQKPKRIAILMAVAETDPDVRAGLKVFSEQLRSLGWGEGQNLLIEYRWGDAKPERIGDFARDLVQLSPDVLVAHSTPPTAALSRETRSIPIVFLTVTDPVGQGLVASLAHPGGNVTGFSVFEASLGAKMAAIVERDSARHQAGPHRFQSGDRALLQPVPAGDRRARCRVHDRACPGSGSR
jgi:putative tryptophan/tyrosine transport system substrate-binding protein